jgi:hypothetical protein
MKKKPSMHPFLKMAGVKTEADFYKKYPSDEEFFAAYPQARYGMMMAQEGVSMPDTPLTGDTPIGGAISLPNAPNDARWKSVQPSLDDQMKAKETQPTALPQPNVPPQPDTTQQPGKKEGGSKNKGATKSFDVSTPDLSLGLLEGISSLMPFTKPKQNISPLPMASTEGAYGFGSHAAAEYGMTMEKGGGLTATKARQILHDKTVHGKPLTEKQRKYFGAVASGYAEDGSSMITQVDPSPYTYFRPMTKQMRQKMDTPNYYTAEDGWRSKVPVQQWDYATKLATASNPLYKDYGKMYSVDNWSGLYEKPASAIETQEPVSVIPQIVPKVSPSGFAATGFPTMAEATTNYKTRKASGQGLPANYFAGNREEGVDPISRLRSTGEETYRYGGVVDTSYHPGMEDHMMMDQHPHKMGMMYKPYHHTYTMEQGGIVPMGEQGLQVEGNQYRYLSPQTIELVGPKHSEGGIDIAYNGNVVEAEGGETFHVDNGGMWSGGNMAADGTSMNAGIVGGNLPVPQWLLDKAGVKNKKMKFKDFFADVIAKRENKIAKEKDKVTKLSNSLNQDNQYEAPLKNALYVKADEIAQGGEELNALKSIATQTQNLPLKIGENLGVEPKYVSQMLNKSAKWGKKMAQGGAQIDPIDTSITKNKKPWAVGEFDPNYTPDIKGNYSTPKPYEFDPLKTGVVSEIPEQEHPAWAYKPDGTKMTPEEMQANVEARGKKEESKDKIKGMRNKFRPLDYLPEAMALLSKPEPVQSMQVQSIMEPTYNMSFQNEKNAIQAAYAPALKATRNPAQQAAIAGQMAEQLANVDAKEFQFNQQNKAGILARNLQEMRGVRDTNLKLAMDAIEKTAKAKTMTEEDKFRAAQSIATKEAARRAQNLQLGMYEQYSGWAYNPETKKKWEMLHPGETFDPRTVTPADLDPETVKSKKTQTTTDSKGKKTTKETTEEKGSQYYGGPVAYFGDYIPGINRTYFGGGAVGGGMGHGAGQGMMSGMMASRYSPGGDTSYYEKKKKTKKRKS